MVIKRHHNQRHTFPLGQHLCLRHILKISLYASTRQRIWNSELQYIFCLKWIDQAKSSSLGFNIRGFLDSGLCSFCFWVFRASQSENALWFKMQNLRINSTLSDVNVSISQIFVFHIWKSSILDKLDRADWFQFRKTQFNLLQKTTRTASHFRPND